MTLEAMNPQQITDWRNNPEGRELALLIKQTLLTKEQWDRLDMSGVSIEDMVELNFPLYAEKDVFSTFEEWNDRLRECGIAPKFIDLTWAVPAE